MDEKKGSSPLAEALRAQILELASKGDSKGSGELTPEILAKIVRVAKTGRDLLVSLNTSPANLAALMKRPQFGFQSANTAMGLDDLGDSESVGPALPMAYSSPTENFGTSAIREIIATMKSVNDSPMKLIEALVEARKAGLKDVAKELERKLGVGKDQIPAKPAKKGKKS